MTKQMTKKMLIVCVGVIGMTCAATTEKKPCPSGGIGADPAQASEQFANFKDYECAKPQICPDEGGRCVLYAVDPGAEAGEVSFVLTNCSTTARLKISKVILVGDDRCSFSEPELDSDTIEPGKATFVRTNYKPKSAGRDHAAIRVISDGENFSQLDLRVCGEGFVRTTDAGPGGGAGQDGGAVVSSFCTTTTTSSPCQAVTTINKTCHQD